MPRRREPVRASAVGVRPLPPLVAGIAESARLSDAWRTDRPGPELRRRRRVVGGTMLSTLCMGVASLYQTGVVRRVPELPLGPFDANRVEASAQAYQVLRMPDAPLAVVSFGLTAALAAAAGAGAGREVQVVRVALGAKALVDIAYSLKLMSDQVTKHGKLCSWCLTTTVGAAVAAGPALAEGRAGWRALRS
ncbi:MAG: hypothetical protein AVDCRST_MAG13-1376 [uncultured Solirubrobacteraceae bacterium]|uniref:Vitamin K epoxide reductase domain-containing protein n=1 Tax=uncultured Solirubrobacteraceae bacterium TaxID=1162706 RepID=A0A6J4RXU9_9ACTN|nr:MAG: hypothetical protein AVDCRST_MAG13-1376 [uncultured Solirubrobacteraceae bacterium]